MALFSLSKYYKPKPAPVEYTATTSIARGQLCEVDFATKTIRPSGHKHTPAMVLERELKEWKP